MITAKHLTDWAGTADAQRELPRLVRRLIHSTATTTQITMPAGDSTWSPGLDGDLESEFGNAWVPKGRSCWEVSCRSDVSTKANEDYEKRSTEFAGGDSNARTYVAATARRWSGKAKWAASKRRDGRWADVRAYDADDLEQWLEQSPSVALAFGEELGLTGPGVSSPSQYFKSWSSQCDPKISPEVLLLGRQAQSERLMQKVRNGVNGQSSLAIPLKADSVEEAVAFAACCVDREPAFASIAVVVTEPSGWRYVEKNLQIRIAVAASPEVAEAPTDRSGLAVIVPYASGDMTRQFKGVAGRLDDAETHLERADFDEFEKALQELGFDENDTRRLSAACGRSWSVYRRQNAVNPAIRRPSWLDHPSSSALSTVCLLGTWSSAKNADKEIVEKISGKSYDVLERELLELERLDDSPILHIGTVWKAKAPIELLKLFGERITGLELDRFFAAAESLLGTPDPQLDLPNDERYAAAIHGKVRPISGFLLEALCNTLIKLAVRGPEVSALAAQHIDARVDNLVRGLLRGVDRVRWLSLASELPALAEASPDEFLSAVEWSLAQSNSPVTSILLETSGSGFMVRCWHAGLLWALETLAWAPQRLTRVSLILARLSETKIAGNWGNNPMGSLVDIYRSWLPQTAATIEQRIAALDVLISKAPTASTILLDSLAHLGHDSASHTARPKWRDDDAGAGYGASHQERIQMLLAASDRQLGLITGDAKGVAALVKKYADFDEERQALVIERINGFIDGSDEDKEIIRSALRSSVNWHRNYSDISGSELDDMLSPLEGAYDRLTPKNIIARHSWLFSEGWPNLPARTREDDYKVRQDSIDRVRQEALSEIFSAHGWEGIAMLIDHSRGTYAIGMTLPRLNIPPDEIVDWIANKAGELALGDDLTAVAGTTMCVLMREQLPDVIEHIFAAADVAGRDVDWKTRLLVLAPEEQTTWDFAIGLGQQAVDLYWSTCLGNLWNLPASDMEFALRRLLKAGRPITALHACHIEFSAIDAELVAQMFEEILKGQESGAQLPDSYHIQKAIDYIESSSKIDTMRIVQLEFHLIMALGFEGEHHARSLYHALMSQPELFVELLSLVFRASDEERRDLSAGEEIAAKNASQILHACTR